MAEVFAEPRSGEFSKFVEERRRARVLQSYGPKDKAIVEGRPARPAESSDRATPASRQSPLMTTPASHRDGEDASVRIPKTERRSCHRQ